MLTRAALIAVAASLQCGCYRPVEDSSRITSTAVVSDGPVAFVYHAYRNRPPLVTFPDGGIPTNVRDDLIIGIAGPEGAVQKLAYFRNTALPGTGRIWLQWFSADPKYLYAFRSGQLEYDLHDPSDELRINIANGATEDLKLKDQLATRGRKLGAVGIGTLSPLDGSGTLLVGATRGARNELWLRSPQGRLRRLIEFDQFERRVGPDIVYSDNGPPFTTYAMNLNSGLVRTIMRYKLHATGLNWHDFDAKDDPAYQALGTAQEQSSSPVHVEVDGTTLTYFNGDRRIWSRQVRF